MTETVGATVVWIGNFLLGKARSVVQEQAQLMMVLRWTELPQIVQVSQVHRQDVVKLDKVLLRYLARAYR